MILICPLQRGHSKGSISKMRFMQVAQLTDGVAGGSSCRVASLGGGFALARSPRALQEYRSTKLTAGAVRLSSRPKPFG
jgi:hypothetical protein